MQSLSSTPSFPGELYRWVDENGVVHFSDFLTDNQLEKYGVKTTIGYDYEESPSPSKRKLEDKKSKPQKIKLQKNEGIKGRIIEDKRKLHKVRRNVRLSSGGYSKQKPYLLDEDPNRPFYRRHPLNRSTTKTIPSSTCKIGPFGKIPPKSNIGAFGKTPPKSNIGPFGKTPPKSNIGAFGKMPSKGANTGPFGKIGGTSSKRPF